MVVRQSHKASFVNERELDGQGEEIRRRTEEERERLWEEEKEAYVKFVQGLSKEERERRGDRLPGEKDNEDSEEEDSEEDGQCKKNISFEIK